MILYGVLHFVGEQIHGLIAQVLQLDQVCKKLKSSGFVATIFSQAVLYKLYSCNENGLRTTS